ncbi:hypothetical protein GTO27_01190 [Candidatus Bathyarchaeota archaeon]|nr:hypothetical protein [Candidatus Bathyarchaeota archaeon]
MSQDIGARFYRSEDLGAIKKILSDYSSLTGRVWSNQLVERMITDALEEQPDGVFVAEKGGKVVGFAIVLHKEYLERRTE